LSRLIAYKLWLLSWLLVVVFAHDFLSKNLNVENQIRFDRIQQNQLNYGWQFNSFDEVVDSFKSDWSLHDDGILSFSDQVELSLELKGDWIYPTYQQMLKWDFSIDSKVNNDAVVLLELSDQEQGVFYYSPELPLSDHSSQIDLNSFAWHKKTAVNQQTSDTTYNWHQLPALNALVIRFYFSDKTKFIIHSVGIQQTEKPEVETLKLNRCQPAMIGCLNTNHLVSLNQEENKQKALPTIEFFVLTDSSSFWWLLLAACALLFGIYLICGRFKPGLLFLVMGVFGFIIIMSQPLVLNTGQYLKWPLLIFAGALFWYSRECLKKPNHAATSLWIGSIIIASLLLLLTGWSSELIWQLPGYFIWALLQQLLLGPVVTDYLFKRLQENCTATAVVSGLLFSVIHTPNHTLMLATFVGGIVWSYAWIKYKNIYANAFSHAVLALVFYQVMPSDWLGSARIGVFF
jgi:membrane protease YdiL (CAAX protease family)